MKTTKFIRTVLMLFVTSLVFTSCSPEDGKDGEQGLQGEPGINGNANVRTTGWVTLPAGEWEQMGGAGNTSYTSPGDIGIPFAVNGWVNFYPSELDGVILVYVDSGSGARLYPTQRSVSGGGKSGAVEFRFAHGTNPEYALWLDPIVALRSGEWDTNYMKNTYLPSLKWKAVIIPTTASENARLQNIDYSEFSYEEICDMFNIPK